MQAVKPAKPKPAKKAEEVERPDVELHDEVFFRHAKGPKCGRVVAHGKHGATVQVDGEHHKVPWEHVLGHKVKVRPDVRVIEHGVDGLIVEDPAGRRRYVHDPIGDEPPALTKSLAPRIVFFGRGDELLKAAGGGRPLKNRPGLAQRQVTDKNGRVANRWMKTGQEAPKERHAGAPDQAGHAPLKHGDKVEVHMQGTVHGEPGPHGAHIRDEHGNVHQIKHEHIRPPKAKLTAKHDEAHDDPDQIARTLFDTSELEKLPKKVNQPVNTWNELHAKAEVGLEEYTGILNQVAKSLDLVTGKRPASFDFAQDEENHKAKEKGRPAKTLNAEEYMLPQHWDDPHGYLFLGPIKGHDRALEKVKSDYTDKHGVEHWDQLRDMVRATIAVPSMTQVPVVLKALKDAGLVPVQQPKNNFVKPLPGGYRDVNMIVRLPNGMLAEMQVHVKPMTLAKEHGHKHYETSRSIVAKYKKNGVEAESENWAPEDRKAHGEAMAEQERIYGEAWDKATKPKSPE